jgi:7-cyano-7-deazaguanine synthase in queuosine biosynthesis
MIIICGPNNDLRELKIELPVTKSKIAIFVSGGLDSALLYYLLCLENKAMNDLHEIVPLTIHRKEGSKNFAKLVVAHVDAEMTRKYVDPLIVGNNQLPEPEQVKSGVQEARKLGFNRAYTGLIEQLPQHMVNWQPIPYSENEFFKAPLKNLNKSHIVDLCVKFNQESLFYITHSCSTWEMSRCNSCNGCNERQWGFEQLGLTDLGRI